MLAISREKGETIWLGDNVEIVILETRGKQVRLGIRARRDIPVYRGEIRDIIKARGETLPDLVPAEPSPTVLIGA